MTKSIGILGHVIEVSEPYAEGHVITAAEAKALNQVRAENIANNFRKRIKDANDKVEGADPIEKVLADLAEYDKIYNFSMTRTASAGPRKSRDPLAVEVRRLAKAMLVKMLTEAGKTFKAYNEEKGAEYVEAKIEEIGATEAIQALAKKNIANANKQAEAIGIGL